MSLSTWKCKCFRLTAHIRPPIGNSKLCEYEPTGKWKSIECVDAQWAHSLSNINVFIVILLLYVCIVEELKICVTYPMCSPKWNRWQLIDQPTHSIDACCTHQQQQYTHTHTRDNNNNQTESAQHTYRDDDDDNGPNNNNSLWSVELVKNAPFSHSHAHRTHTHSVSLAWIPDMYRNLCNCAFSN